MTQKKGKGNDTEVFTLYESDGSFTIKPRKINVKKSRKKKKKDVRTELENTKMDMIQ
jgi:hypothetical protein